MAKKLAFVTIGILHEPLGAARSQGFVDRIPGVFDAADASSGFVARSVRNMETYERSWGELEIPECLSDIGDVLRLPSTLSLWDDLESVAAFAYHGAHGEAMAKRREWFMAAKVPTYVAWWVDSSDRIDPKEAKDRLDHLHKFGPTPMAFDFKKPFDADGNPISLSQQAVKDKIAANASNA